MCMTQCSVALQGQQGPSKVGQKVVQDNSLGSACSQMVCAKYMAMLLCGCGIECHVNCMSAYQYHPCQ